MLAEQVDDRRLMGEEAPVIVVCLDRRFDLEPPAVVGRLGGSPIASGVAVIGLEGEAVRELMELEF